MKRTISRLVLAATLSVAANNSAAAQLFDYPGAYWQRGGSVAPSGKSAAKPIAKGGNPHEASHGIQQGSGQSVPSGSTQPYILGPLWNPRPSKTK